MSSLTAIHIGKHTKPVNWPVRMCEGFRNKGNLRQSPFLPAVRLYWDGNLSRLGGASCIIMAQITVFSNPAKLYGGDPYTFLFAPLLVLVFGAGSLSFDAAIAKRWRKRA